MLVDLDHNKIISDTATQGFRASFNNKLLPLLSEKYGDSLKGVQMYEDYIADGFSEGDVWFYPLTLIFDGSYETQWIKWSYSQNDFKNGIPYSYIGDGEIDFELADTVPQQFTDAILGRNTYCAGGGIPITVSAATDDPTFLCGKYSQTFIDMMSEKITEEITKAMSVSGIENSTLELSLVFAPDTYMEHTSENVTYRRLLISDKSCGARDFWIKWTRLDSAVAYSVSDTPRADDIKFELGEDVSQKIREREYRFLVRGNIDKYHMAMGRKNITEWREIIKRAIKRGDLVKVVRDVEIAEHAASVSDKLSELLAGLGAPAVTNEEPIITASEKSDDDLAKALEMARAAVLGQYDSSDSDEDNSDNSDDDGDSFVTFDENSEEEELVEDEREVEAEEEIEEIDSEDLDEDDESMEDDDELISLDTEDETDEDALIEVAALEPDEDEEEEAQLEVSDTEEDEDEEEEQLAVAGSDESCDSFDEEECEAEITDTTPTATVEQMSDLARKEAEEAIRKMHEERIRAEVEANIRYEMESTARQKAEEEAERLRREHKALMEENEKLYALAKKAEEERLRAEAEKQAHEEERRIEEAKLRAQIEAQLRAEAREKARIAEAAHLEIEAQRRKEDEERKRLEADDRLAKQQARAEELSRLEAERIAEAERINHEIEELRREKLAMEAKVAASSGVPAQPPVNNEPTVVEEQKPVQKSQGQMEYTYTSRHARLLFRRPVDPNITKHIHEIIKKTMIERGKENVYIRIKADIPDANTVDLNFVQIPEEEGELLVAIIQALGESGMGIAKAILN